MARGPKKKLEDQIRNMNDQIDRARNKLDELLAQKEALEQQKREAEVGRLYNLMVESGKSVEEIEQYLLGQTDSQDIA